MGKGLEYIAPEPAMLISEAMDERRPGKRPETAVLIPTYKNPAALRAHLRKLASQAWKQFDIIIIYGEDDDFENAPDGLSGILHIRERGTLGCAGAYYLAERIALDDGYAFIIEADDDCQPESDSLIGSLVDSARSGPGIAFPLVRFGENRVAARAGNPHYYGCFRRECFEKAGLTFLPLFFGGEDIEIMDRMGKSGFTAKYIDGTVIHPPMRPVLINTPERSYFYYRGEIEASVLSSRYISAFAAFTTYAALAAAHLAFGNFHGAGMVGRAVWDASGLRFFLEKQVAVKPGKEGMHGEQSGMDGSSASHPGPVVGNGPCDIARSWRFALTHAGKEVTFLSWNSRHSMPSALLARSAFIVYDGSPYVIFRDRSAAHIALGVLLVALAIPVLPFLSLLLVSRGFLLAFIRRPGNRGYGISGASERGRAPVRHFDK